MPRLKAWLEEHDYPFEFSTEASINLADDDEMLQAMKDANFFAVFVGIESPDPETLVQMRKKQNTKRNIAESVHKIYRYGMFVTAGFILGFDTEKVSVAQSMTDFIEECCVPICMVGLLYALPGTQLTRRLAKEGRLHQGHDIMRVEQAGDQCTLGCNFDTKRPLRDILTDYRTVLTNVFSPQAYAGRLSRLSAMLDRSGRPKQLADGDIRKNHGVERALPDHQPAARGARAVLEDLRRGRQEEPRRAAPDRHHDGDLPASRAVLEARDLRDRPAHRRTGRRAPPCRRLSAYREPAVASGVDAHFCREIPCRRRKSDFID